jgi:thymidine phosphorylase
VLATNMLAVANVDDAAARVDNALDSGAAYVTFEKMLALQGARPGALASLSAHPRFARVVATRSGFVTHVDTPALGEAARELVARAGPGAGVRVHVRVGDAVAFDAHLATVYGDGAFAEPVRAAIAIGDAPPQARPLVAYEMD